MIPGDYKTFEFQLQQVQKQLESDPKNESLQKLEKKLQRLLELSKSLSQESQAAGDQSAQNAASINLAAGDQCDAKNKGVWQEAVIQSVSQDKRTCTVVFVGSAETCHCKAEEIRKPTVHTLQRKKEAEMTERPPKRPTLESARTERSSAQDTAKKGTKAEYIRKKEEEHQQTQENWQKFSQKMGIGRSAGKPRK